ncbi:hypothetical protein AB1Y20_012317 [Prymnesium parvum]|uniref:EF-hand domain-containing protein n=1 Tax=Prymnesium parvum TaxID=97485 RepID=A0AB34IQM8_PRYPA
MRPSVQARIEAGRAWHAERALLLDARAAAAPASSRRGPTKRSAPPPRRPPPAASAERAAVLIQSRQRGRAARRANRPSALEAAKAARREAARRGFRDEEAARRGAQRSHDYVAFLRGASSGPIAKLEEYKFHFDESTALRTLQERVVSEAQQAVEHAASKQKLLAARPEPPGLTAFEQKLWLAFCAVDTDGSGTIPRRELTNALDRAAMASIRAKHASGKPPRVEWHEFRLIGQQLCRRAEVSEAAAATRIQAALRGSAARKSVRAERRRAAEALLRERARRLYAAGKGGGAVKEKPAGKESRAVRGKGAVGKGEHSFMEKGNHSSVGKGNHSSVGKGEHSFMEKGNHSSVGKGNHSSVGKGEHSFMEKGNYSSVGKGDHSFIEKSFVGKGSQHLLGSHAYHSGSALTEEGGEGTAAAQWAWGGAREEAWPVVAEEPFDLSVGGEAAAAAAARAARREGERRRAQAALGIQRLARARLARKAAEALKREQAQERQYFEELQRTTAAERALLARAVRMVGVAPPAEATAAPPHAKARAAERTRRRRQADGRAAKKAPPPHQKIAPAAMAAALHSAMLATAFASECDEGKDTIPMRSLRTVLRRAHVPGGEELSDAVGGPFAHVSLKLHEVALIAHKLRSRAKSAKGVAEARGAAWASTSDPSALPREVRTALARGFAQLDDDAAGSLPASAVPAALAFAGIAASPPALHLLLGGAVDDRRRVEWREFMQLASTLLEFQPSARVPASAEAVADATVPASAALGSVVVSVDKVHLLQPPLHPLLLTVLATPAAASGEARLPARRSAPFSMDGTDAPVGLTLHVSPRRALTLAVEARLASGEAAQSLDGEASAHTLLRAARASASCGTPVHVPVSLCDATSGEQHGVIFLTLAPPHIMASVRSPSLEGGGAEAALSPSPAPREESGSPPPRDLAGGTLTRREVEERLWQAFLAVNEDGKPYLSRRELYRALELAGITHSQAQLLRVYRAANRHRDDQVDWPAFLLLGEQLHRLATLDAMDAAAGGKPTPSPPQRGGEAREAAARRIQQTYRGRRGA